MKIITYPEPFFGIPKMDRSHMEVRIVGNSYSAASNVFDISDIGVSSKADEDAVRRV